MRFTLTVLGAWLIVFPFTVVMTTTVIILGLFIKLFNMPLDVWVELREELENIHRKE